MARRGVEDKARLTMVIDAHKLTKVLSKTLIRRGLLTKDAGAKARRCYILAAYGNAIKSTGLPDRDIPDYTDEQVSAADMVLLGMLYLEALGVPEINELLKNRADYLSKEKQMKFRIPTE